MPRQTIVGLEVVFLLEVNEVILGIFGGFVFFGGFYLPCVESSFAGGLTFAAAIFTFLSSSFTSIFSATLAVGASIVEL